MPEKQEKKRRDYGAIVPDTIESMMGSERWNALKHELFKAYGTAQVVVGHHQGGPKLYLRDAYGKCLGTVGHVEDWAIKQLRKRQKGRKSSGHKK